MLRGVVCSTSVMACDSESPSGQGGWVQQLRNRVGIHLQLTEGTPCADPGLIPSLLSPDGHFPRWPGNVENPKKQEILIEWHAQVSRALAWGLVPTHVDTHHHVHTLPIVFDAYCEIARYYGLPARTKDAAMTFRLRSAGVRCADVCETAWFRRHLSVHGLIKLITSDFKILGDHATLELMCHPGYVDLGLGEGLPMPRNGKPNWRPCATPTWRHISGGRISCSSIAPPSARRSGAEPHEKTGYCVGRLRSPYPEYVALQSAP